MTDPAPIDQFRLVCVRHGEPEQRARGRVYGKLDVGLSLAGREQVRRAVAVCRAWRPTVVYASPRTRARQSAEILASALGQDVTVEAAFAELDFGRFEGRTYEEVERDYPDVYRRWMDAPTQVEFPDGESYSQLRARVLAGLKRIRAMHVGGVVMVVAHGGVIRAVLADALGLDAAAIFRLDQSYAGVSVVDYRTGFSLLRTLNVVV
ncbi:MAG: histidine phosphatase family protein [Myxococcales bacterium FL481]|nr:MAG: histidine phosphatase family protein [Myxococcales bacterium FL481]